MKHIKSLFTLLLLVCVLTSCSGEFDFGPGFSDFVFDELPSGYEVWKVNSRSIVLQKRDGDDRLKEVVGTLVSKIAWNDDYIFVQQVPVPENRKTPIDYGNPSFFIVPAAEGDPLGPYSEEEFLTQYEALDIGGDLEWIKAEDLRSRIKADAK